MPSLGPGFGLTEEAVRKLRRLLNRVEHGLRLREGRPAQPQGRPIAQFSGWVQVTSLVTVSGRYPAQTGLDTLEELDTPTIEAQGSPGDVHLRTVNGSALTTGVWYWARLEGDSLAGVPVYVVDDGSGPAGGSSLTVTPSTVAGVTTLNGDAGGVITFTGTTPNATLVVAAATAGQVGVVTTGSQEFAGSKWLTSGAFLAFGTIAATVGEVGTIGVTVGGDVQSGTFVSSTVALLVVNSHAPSGDASCELTTFGAGASYFACDGQAGVTGTSGGGDTVTGGLITALGSGGVTSVSGAGGTTGLSLTGGPITATGTLTLGGTLALASGGTGASLSDPAADKILAWDDTDNAVGFWTLGTGLTYTHSTHTLSAPPAGIAIGDPVGSGTATYVLFVDGSANLGQSANLTFAASGGLAVTAGGDGQVAVTGFGSVATVIGRLGSNTAGTLAYGAFGFYATTPHSLQGYLGYADLFGSVFAAGYFNDGTTQVHLCNETTAAAFTDGTRTVTICDGTNHVSYLATTASDWAASTPPTDIWVALDRIAALLKVLNAGTGP